MKNYKNNLNDTTPTTPNTEDVATQRIDEKKCAPGLDFESGSCIGLPVLIEMATAYNNSNPNNKIKFYDRLETLNPKKYKKYLLQEIKNRFKNVCDGQICWTQQDFIDKMDDTLRLELDKFTFRPKGPQGKFQWLSTVNIDDVMMQYENILPNFEFLGAVPVDFDDLKNLGIKDLNYEKLVKKGKTKIGIIFNLDEHWKSGSHWVAGFANLKRGEVYFYDSYGSRPPERIRKLLRRFARKSEELFGIRCDAKYNKIRHQYGSSECGVYSINFLLSLLNGDSFEDICNSKTPDKEVNKLRSTLFRNVNFK